MNAPIADEAAQVFAAPMSYADGPRRCDRRRRVGYLSYVSGNRDEEVFCDPVLFDVGRDPNKHLALGYGVHFCLGAALARMEVSSSSSSRYRGSNPLN